MVPLLVRLGSSGRCHTGSGFHNQASGMDGVKLVLLMGAACVRLVTVMDGVKQYTVRSVWAVGVLGMQ